MFPISPSTFRSSQLASTIDLSRAYSTLVDYISWLRSLFWYSFFHSPENHKSAHFLSLLTYCWNKCGFLDSECYSMYFFCCRLGLLSQCFKLHWTIKTTLIQTFWLLSYFQNWPHSWCQNKFQLKGKLFLLVYLSFSGFLSSISISWILPISLLMPRYLLPF